MEAIKNKRQHLYFLLKNNNLLQAKEHILAGYGVEHISDLSEALLDEAIARIIDIAIAKEAIASREVRMWRHKILRKMSEFMNTTDWSNVNTFMLDKRVAGKHLYECNVSELKVLLRKISKISEVIKERDNKLARTALLN
jgi:hypothetical protein